MPELVSPVVVSVQLEFVLQVVVSLSVQVEDSEVEEAVVSSLHDEDDSTLFEEVTVKVPEVLVTAPKPLVVDWV